MERKTNLGLIYSKKHSILCKSYSKKRVEVQVVLSRQKISPEPYHVWRHFSCFRTFLKFLFAILWIIFRPFQVFSDFFVSVKSVQSLGQLKCRHFWTILDDFRQHFRCFQGHLDILMPCFLFFNLFYIFGPCLANFGIFKLVWSLGQFEIQAIFKGLDHFQHNFSHFWAYLMFLGRVWCFLGSFLKLLGHSSAAVDQLSLQKL